MADPAAGSAEAFGGAEQTHKATSEYYAGITRKVLSEGRGGAGCGACADGSCGACDASRRKASAKASGAADRAGCCVAPSAAATSAGCCAPGSGSCAPASGSCAPSDGCCSAPAPSTGGGACCAPPSGGGAPGDDLLLTSCCDVGAERSPAVAAAVRKLHPEVAASFYGCGSPLPPALSGATVVDLGSGTGFDVYVAAQLVGPDGTVIGVDMTEEQLAVARKHEAWHMEQFGFERSNVRHVHGLIEDLAAAGIADDSVDVVISNCVINLAPDKRAVLAEAYRVLKPGGELYFGDVFADRRFPKELMADPVFHGECLSGALYFGDFRRLMRELGFAVHWVVTDRPLTVASKLAARMGEIRCVSRTVRAFKVDGLEDDREDYGQTATYKGGLVDAEETFTFDQHTSFAKGVPTRVDGNTALVLTKTRYAPFFHVTPRGPHRGAFTSATAAPAREIVRFDVESARPPQSKLPKCC